MDISLGILIGNHNIAAQGDNKNNKIFMIFESYLYDYLLCNGQINFSLTQLVRQASILETGNSLGKSCQEICGAHFSNSPDIFLKGRIL